MQFKTVLAPTALLFVTSMAAAVPQPESIEGSIQDMKLSIRDAFEKFRRAEMVETGPVQLCAPVCVKGKKEGSYCTTAKGQCPGGKCEMLCD
jgi:hypothetical protein